MIDKERWAFVMDGLKNAPDNRKEHAKHVIYDLETAEAIRQCMGLAGENCTVLIAAMIQKERHR